MQVRWHRSLDDVKGEAPALYIAHEFFDALPVHQFQRTGRGWRERLVDVAQDPGDPHHLRLVLAPNETPASKLLLPLRLAALSPAKSGRFGSTPMSFVLHLVRWPDSCFSKSWHSKGPEPCFQCMEVSLVYFNLPSTAQHMAAAGLLA